MVLQIEEYPRFVPWCIDGKVEKKIDKVDAIEITANLTIGKGFFRDTYKSFIIYDKKKDSINVTNIGGPLKHLENKWVFKSVGKSSEVNFYVNFELRNKILNILMAKYFKIGLKKVADAFEKRATELFDNSQN